MKIYRGPSEKDFFDDTHQLVSNIDVPSNTSPWTSVTRFRANITKDGIFRQSVAHIEMQAGDIIALHRALVEGLQSEAVKCQALWEMVRSLERALDQIRITALLATHSDLSDAVAKIKTCAEDALKKSIETGASLIHEKK